MSTPLVALSPLDGRYADKTSALQDYFSEGALIRHRILVEVEWLIYLCKEIKLPGTRMLSKEEISWLKALYDRPLLAMQGVKDIEKVTNHDVKSIEYFLKQSMENHSTADLREFVHFGCTSEDITNLSYGIMLKSAMGMVILPAIKNVLKAIMELAEQGRNIAMLAHTHGQPASPTTVGKEVVNVLMRLKRQIEQLEAQQILGKMNGAVGNWNAHHIAYPEIDWPGFSNRFIKNLGLVPMMYTTHLAELSHNLMRLNTILIDFDRDMWMYVGKNYFAQKLKEGEVGSSTMPHKVNPIDFENSEGNLGLANAFLGHFALKLPISRMQRDLSDSTVLRNIGSALGYCLLGYQGALKGLSKVKIDEEFLAKDLDNHWEVLAEALQTVMRRYKIEKPYEKLKELTRGKGLTAEDYRKFVQTLEIPESERNRLAALTPGKYVGLAEELVSQALAGGKTN